MTRTTTKVLAGVAIAALAAAGVAAAVNSRRGRNLIPNSTPIWMSWTPGSMWLKDWAAIPHRAGSDGSSIACSAIGVSRWGVYGVGSQA